MACGGDVPSPRRTRSDVDDLRDVPMRRKKRCTQPTSSSEDNNERCSTRSGRARAPEGQQGELTKQISVVIHGVVGWAICGATIGVGREVISMEPEEDNSGGGDCDSHEERTATTRSRRGGERLTDCSRIRFHMHGRENTRRAVRESMPRALIDRSQSIPW